MATTCQILRSLLPNWAIRIKLICATTFVVCRDTPRKPIGDDSPDRCRVPTSIPWSILNLLKAVKTVLEPILAMKTS